MKNVIIISVSLERKQAEILDRLAQQYGSRSAAVRKLLTRYERDDMERQYREYYAQPGVAEADSAVAEEMLSIAALNDFAEARKHAARHRKTRKRIRR